MTLLDWSMVLFITVIVTTVMTLFIKELKNDAQDKE